MKLKKLLAVALSAVMAVSVLSACGGSGIFEKTTLDMTGVTDLLKDENVAVSSDNGLDAVMADVVTAVKDGSLDVTNPAAVDKFMEDNAKWSSWPILGFIPGTYGSVYVLKEEEVKNPEDFHSGSWKTNDKIDALAPIDTPEKVAAAGILYWEGKTALSSWLTANAYNASAVKVKADGIAYWVVAVQTNITSNV